MSFICIKIEFKLFLIAYRFQDYRSNFLRFKLVLLSSVVLDDLFKRLFLLFSFVNVSATDVDYNFVPAGRSPRQNHELNLEIMKCT